MRRNTRQSARRSMILCATMSRSVFILTTTFYKFICFVFQDTACTTIDETKCEKVVRGYMMHDHHDDGDDGAQVYEDKCSVIYETAYEEQCRTEQEQVPMLFLMMMIVMV